VRLKDVTPPKAAKSRFGASPPRRVVSAKSAQTSRVNPTARKYPFEPTAPAPRPAAKVPSWATPIATSVAKAPPGGLLQPVQHQAPQRMPFVNDLDDDRDDDDDDAAPSMFADEDVIPGAATVAAESDCPAITEQDLAEFNQGIDATTKRRPIGAMRADMKPRLAREHSSLIDDKDYASVRERGLCAVERDRAIVREFFHQRFGLGYDRSSGAYWCDDSLAPEFPFCYHPLYFEDPNLERCGYSKGCCCQPLVSGFQFYGNVALLPIKMLILHPCSYVYPQCDCEPCTRYSCADNMLGPCPESLFRSPCWSHGRKCR
jgi:hypothetical protein